MVEKVRPRRFAKVSYLRVFARSTAGWVEALDFAMHMVAEPDTELPAPLDSQLILDLEAAIARTQKNCSPCIFYLRSVQDDHVINHTQIASAYVINKHASARFDRGLDDSS